VLADFAELDDELKIVPSIAPILGYLEAGRIGVVKAEAVSPDSKSSKDKKLLLKKIHGFQPKVFSKGFLKMLLTRKISEDLAFTFCKHTLTGYCGYAKLQSLN